MASHHSYQVHRRQIEHWLTYIVDFSVPAEGGLGKRLDDMIEWCRDNLDANVWAQYGNAEQDPGQAP
ncbi:MAG: hypothetical protein QF926_08245 [Alphaproteobacteria bacterium]|jgi:hypothetical protein|nr:hypothetical protein [Alphaproteobacteria bacterium]MDP6516596.1 hypothetical protein [Alphaproteobacteria bacterium]|tara:strand:- start:430 stop:630 length:201 start_codon:yes stop_codon:yes gene_type:complete